MTPQKKEKRRILKAKIKKVIKSMFDTIGKQLLKEAISKLCKIKTK